MSSFSWPPQNSFGSIVLNGSTSGALTLTVPAVVTSYTLIFPAAQGGASTLLQNDGAGNLSWVSSSSLSIGAIDGQTAVANGLQIVASVLYAQSASSTRPGMVNNTTQTFSGVKTFSSAPNLSSLSASLPLQLDASKNMTAVAIDLSGTQATGTLAAGRFPALTGDITTSAGALATTLATVNANVGSFTNGSFTVNAKGLITAASSGTAPVTAISIASANGFAGSSSGGATPALTLTTSITGVLQGNGTAISAATTTGSGNVVLATGPAITIDASCLTTGALPAGRFPALTGDITTSAGSLATTAAATQANISSLSKSTGVAVHGTNTNDSASAGFVGEYIESLVTSATSMTAASGAFQDATSITLSAGDWDVSFAVYFISQAAASLSTVACGISTTTGNSGTGLQLGVNYFGNDYTTGLGTGLSASINVPVYRMSVSGSTITYGKLVTAYATTAPKFECRLSARRVR